MAAGLAALTEVLTKDAYDHLGKLGTQLAEGCAKAMNDSGIPGHLPHQLASWWEHGEGAAKIAWGTPGSFMRCVRLAEDA